MAVRDHTPPADKLLYLANDVREGELAQLLADVRRMADGLDGIKQLVVEGPLRQPEPVELRPSHETREIERALRERVARARCSGERHVAVHVGDLEQLLDALSQIGKRS